MTVRKNTGNFGEQLALKYLVNCGYEVLDVNWRYKRWEADIIVKDQDTLVFVEVKTRSSQAFGLPEDFVDRKKEDNLLKLADVYIARKKHIGEIRFDIVSILLCQEIKIEHIKDAFWRY